MGEIEKIGSGIRRMKEAAKRAHVKPPLFETSGFFVALFRRPVEYFGEHDASFAVDEKTVEKTVEKMLKLIESYPDSVKFITKIREMSFPSKREARL